MNLLQETLQNGLYLKFNSASDLVIIAQEFATLEGKFKSLIP